MIGIRSLLQIHARPSVIHSLRSTFAPLAGSEAVRVLARGATGMGIPRLSVRLYFTPTHKIDSETYSLATSSPVSVP
jgi:hypothetical protein